MKPQELEAKDRPIRQMTKIYAKKSGEFLTPEIKPPREGEQERSKMWLQPPNGWQRTGAAGKMEEETRPQENENNKDRIKKIKAI